MDWASLCIKSALRPLVQAQDKITGNNEVAVMSTFNYFRNFDKGLDQNSEIT